MEEKVITSHKKVSEKNEAVLHESILDAEMLLNHAAERGLELQEENIKAIVEANFMLREDALDKDVIIRFWLAYNAISKQIRPATIDSIKASKEIAIINPGFVARLFRRTSYSSLAHRSVRRYMAFAIISIIVMLLLQIYALRGTTILKAVFEKKEKLTQLEDELVNANLFIQSDGENRNSASRRLQIGNNIDELDREIKSTIDLLESWLRFSKIAVPTTSEPEAPTAMAEMLNTTNVMQVEESKIEENVKIIQEAQNLAQILGLYILPLLYGLLGGVVFVLRLIADEVKRLVFSKESTTKYTLRILLGAIAGLSVGLFWNDIQTQQSGFIASLSLLFVAFITGYSLEYLFMIIDTFISKVTGKKVEAEVIISKETPAKQ